MATSATILTLVLYCCLVMTSGAIQYGVPTSSRVEWTPMLSKVSPIFMVLFLANSIVKVRLLTQTLPQPLIPLAAMVVRMLYLRQHQMHSLGKLCDSPSSLSLLNSVHQFMP